MHQTYAEVAAEVGRAVVVGPEGGEKRLLVGDVYRLVLSGRQTGGAFALFAAECSPGLGPPPHLHEREAETFYVLEGELTVTTEGREVKVGPGGAVHLPRGEPHSFQNQGQQMARMLVQVAPGGNFEDYVLAVGEAVGEDRVAGAPPNAEHIRKVLRAGAKYGIRFV